MFIGSRRGITTKGRVCGKETIDRPERASLESHRPRVAKPMSFLPTVKVWIWVSALASLAGWTLSPLGQLNAAGYIVFSLAVAVVVFAAREKCALSLPAGTCPWKKFSHRFRRAFPLMFLVLAALALLGRVIYPPTNHTGLSYRIPRVLQWLDEDGWFWI